MPDDATRPYNVTFDNGMSLRFTVPAALTEAECNDFADRCYSSLSPRPSASDTALVKMGQRSALLTCFNNEVRKWKLTRGGESLPPLGNVHGNSTALSECKRRAERFRLECLGRDPDNPDEPPDELPTYAEMERCEAVHRINLQQCERMFRGESLSQGANGDDPCARCAISDLPSCVYCAGLKITNGLLAVGVNLLLGAAVALGLYFLVKD